jgi:hypothetical protein
MLWRIIFVALLLMAVRTFAHDMSDPDAEWFQSLKVPGDVGFGGSLAGSSCCNGGHGVDADCKNVEVRERNGHWEAWIDSKTFPDTTYSPIYGHAPNAWVTVPDDVIIHGRANPTGRPVACWYNQSIRCFVEGIQT